MFGEIFVTTSSSTKLANKYININYIIVAKV